MDELPMSSVSGRHDVPLKAYLIGFGIAIALAVLIGVFKKRAEVHYRLPHQFAVSAPEFFPSAHALARPVPIGGNQIDILKNGDEIFPALLEAIAGAKKTINFEAYIFWSGEIGSKFRDALCERARQGVKVRIVLDGIGSGKKLDNDDVDAMKQAGCEFGYYHPMLSLRFDKGNRRTHRRILVVDGSTAFTGSVGFADEWQGNADSPKHWRDTQIRIRGPLVAALQSAFVLHWAKVKREAIAGSDDFPPLTPAGNLSCQLVTSASFTTAAIPLLYAVAISSATERLWLANAYFMPDRDLVILLVEAATRGVDVRVLVPGPINDVPATKAGGRSVFGDLLRGGVKIFEYQPTMFHHKTLVVDSRFSMLGSTNFDSRSFRVNEELDVTVYDETFAKQMEGMFEEDLTHSKEYTLPDFNKRSLKERLTEQLVQPFRSEL